MEYKIWEDGFFDVLSTLKSDNEVLQKQSLAKIEKFKTFKALFSRSPADIGIILESYKKIESLGNELILEIEKTSF